MQKQRSKGIMRFARLRFALLGILNFIDPPELPDPAEHPIQKVVVPCLECARREMIAHGSEPPPLWSAIYEPPAPTSDKQPSAELARLFGPTATQSLPTVDPATGYYLENGRLARKVERHKQESA